MKDSKKITHFIFPKSLLVALTLQNASLSSEGLLNTALKNLQKRAHSAYVNLRYTLQEQDKPSFFFTSLQEIEQALRALESTALEEIKKSFTIQDNKWDDFLLFKKNLKEKTVQKLAQTDPQRTHSTELPPALLNRVRSLLSYHLLNPDAITIVPLNEKPHKFAKTIGPVHDNLTATLLINPTVAQLPPYEQHYIIAHEIAHLKENHSDIIYLNAVLQTHNKQLTIEEIHTHPTYLWYLKIQELIADLLLAITHKEIAENILTTIEEKYLANPHKAALNYPTPAELYPWIKAIVYCHQNRLD